MPYINQSTIQQVGHDNVIQLIGTDSSEGKPLNQCNGEELKQERLWRQKLLDKERRRQWFLLLKLLAWLLSGGSASWFTSHWLPWSHWLQLGLVGFGVVLPGMAIYALSQRGDSEFALRQIATLREIAHLQREKGPI